MDIMAKNQRNQRNQRNQTNQRNQPDQPPPSRDSWVKVNPDEPAYQRLHLCKYLAELPDLSTEKQPDTASDTASDTAAE